MKKIETILKPYINSNFKFRVCSNDYSYLKPESRVQLNKPHITNAFYLYFLIKGNCQHQIDLKNYQLSEGEVVILFPNQVHFHNKENSNNLYFELFIEESNQFVLNKELPVFTNPLNKNLFLLSSFTIPTFSFLFQKLIEFQYKKSVNEQLHLAYLNVLLEEINLAYFGFNKEKEVKFEQKDIEVMIAFKNSLSKNLGKRFSIKTIAKELGVSTNYLYKIVKRHTNKSPKDFIQFFLMNEAKRQLFYSPISIKELAYKLGYSDPAYFSRAFKKVVGKSAQEFRKDLSNTYKDNSY